MGLSVLRYVQCFQLLLVLFWLVTWHLGSSWVPFSVVTSINEVLFFFLFHLSSCLVYNTVVPSTSCCHGRLHSCPCRHLMNNELEIYVTPWL